MAIVVSTLFFAFIISIEPSLSASVKAGDGVEPAPGPRAAKVLPGFRADPEANQMIDNVIDRFMRSPWFRALVSPAFFVDGEVELNRWMTLKNVKIRGLEQRLFRMGDVTIRNEPAAKVFNITLGPWQNLSIEADYVTGASRRIAGSLSGSIPEIAVSLLAAVEGNNGSDFSVVLREFDVVDSGPFQLDSLSGLWLFSTPARYLINMLLPMLQARAVPLIEDKVQTLTTLMLQDAQTLALLRP